jgi:formylglycine-generating enzyme required for sulfatase activity
MKRIPILFAFPVIFGLAAFVSAGETPDPVPVINGMIFIPAGEFTMGSNLSDLKNLAEVDEFPQRTVYVDAFYVDIHEVTNAEYKYYVDSMEVEPPHRWENGNYAIGLDGYPVVDISWEEAAAYARFVGKRLPTEAEWEKAARGTNGRIYPWGDSFSNTHANNSDRLAPVMSFPDGKSPYGVFDMAGNAAEWVDAWYDAYPRTEDDVLPKEFAVRKQRFPEKKYRVYRGGSWNSFGKFLRCANREREKPDKKWLYIGFRCVMDPPWEKE